MITRILIATLVALVAFPASVWPCAKSTAKPFDPQRTNYYWVDPQGYEQDPLLYTCIRGGPSLWNGPDTPVVAQECPIQAPSRISGPRARR